MYNSNNNNNNIFDRYNNNNPINIFVYHKYMVHYNIDGNQIELTLILDNSIHFLTINNKKIKFEKKIKIEKNKFYQGIPSLNKELIKTYVIHNEKYHDILLTIKKEIFNGTKPAELTNKIDQFIKNYFLENYI